MNRIGMGAVQCVLWQLLMILLLPILHEIMHTNGLQMFYASMRSRASYHGICHSLTCPMIYSGSLNEGKDR